MNATSQADKVEQALAEGRAEMLAAFGAKAAHDFNNLLAVILGNTELIEETTDDAEMAPMLRLIREAGERGEQLAARLMLISGGEASAAPQEQAPSSIAGVEERIQEILGTRCHIEFVIEPPSRAAVEGPALDAALLLLCLCLCKIMPQGAGLSISVLPEAAIRA